MRTNRFLSPAAFTLVELLVVIVIIGILSAMTLAGLARAASRGKADTTKFIIRKLSDAIMEHYEAYEDLRLSGYSLLDVRRRMREELPDSWAEVPAPAASPPPLTSAGAAYRRYKAAATPTIEYGSAECLYMIVRESGLFGDLMASIQAQRVGDIDGDGAPEFWDGWMRPIAFFRWAPGFSSDPSAVTNPRAFSPIQIADPVNFHDPVDNDYSPGPPPAGDDQHAFAMYPLIFSPGPDEAENSPLSSENSGYGLLPAKTGWKGENQDKDDALLMDICRFKEEKHELLIGTPDPDNANAYRDNITNHQLIAE